MYGGVFSVLPDGRGTRYFRMKAERLFLLMLLAILGLLVTSTVLGFFFFRGLAQAPPTAQAPPAVKPVAAPGPLMPDIGHLTGSSLLVGLSGHEQKYDLKAPLLPPSAHYPFPQQPPPAQLARLDELYADLHLLFEDRCEGYGGPVDFSAPGARFSVWLGESEVCLDMRRPTIEINEGHDRVTFSPRSIDVDACDLDQQVILCMRMLGLDFDGATTATVPGEDGTAERTSRRDPDTFRLWHSDLIYQPDESDEESLVTEVNGLYRELTLEQPVARNNYFLGTDPRGWLAGEALYPKVRYTDLYPGIDLACYDTKDHLEYVFVLWPGADRSAIQFTFDGTDEVSLDGWGNLILHFRCGKIVQHRPRAYQVVDGAPLRIPARYLLEREKVRAELDPYPVSDLLLAATRLAEPADESGFGTDPGAKSVSASRTLDILSFLGGSGNDHAYATTVDRFGYAYVVGAADSSSFAVARSSARPATNSIDVFVCKYRLSDSQVMYTTFIGGTSEDRALAVAADNSGNAYICGETLSADFPATNALEHLQGGASWNSFVAKLDPSGAVVDFCSRLGGSADDRAYGLALDPQTNLYIAGETWSDDFPAVNAFRTPRKPGTRDAFVVKLDVARGMIRYAATLGGSGHDAAYAVAVGPRGSAYLAGETSSRDLPTREAFQPKHGGGFYDGFLAKFTPSADALAACTYLGGTNDDRCYGLSVDVAANTYVSGETSSQDFPVTNSVQTLHGGGDWDAFLTKFTRDPRSPPLYSTFLGGSGSDRAFSVANDGSGNAHVVGATSSTNLFVRDAAQEQHAGGAWDAFAAKVDAGGGRFFYSTYLGGPGDDFLYSVTVDAKRSAHVAGATSSTNLPLANPLQTTHAGARYDAMVGRLLPEYYLGPDLRLVPAGGQPMGPQYDYYVSRMEVSNDEVARFLNDAQANTNDARGTNMFFDARGNVWFNPAMEREAHEMFSIGDARIEYNPDFPAGSRYYVTPRIPRDGGSYSNHPAVGVSWYGAVKYCNWLTIETGRGGDQRCYREGTNSVDWAPVTCVVSNWVLGRFLQSERDEWLAYEGYRLPMDNCDVPSDWINDLFRVPNVEFARFLNDAQANPGSEKGSLTYFDSVGNVWFNPAMANNSTLMFSIYGTRLTYDLTRSEGNRYGISAHIPPQGSSYSNYPVDNVTWPGAMKYCNWLTLESGLGSEQRCYSEGTNKLDWIPVTAVPEAWARGEFSKEQIREWLELDGVHLPLDTCSPTGSWAQADLAGYMPTGSWANAYNEFYKAAAWTGATNVPYGFGRSVFDVRDANYLDSGAFAKHDTSAGGYYNGRTLIEQGSTHTNANYFGIYDLSGNVSEWLTDPGRSGTLGDRACYGGSWLFALPQVSQRFFVHPHFTDNFRGFRVVSTYTPETIFLVRMPYHICLCGYGTGKGCEEEVPEEKVEKVPVEEHKYNVLTVEEVPPEEGIIYKPEEEEEESVALQVPLLPLLLPPLLPPLETVGDD